MELLGSLNRKEYTPDNVTRLLNVYENLQNPVSINRKIDSHQDDAELGDFIKAKNKPVLERIIEAEQSLDQPVLETIKSLDTGPVYIKILRERLVDRVDFKELSLKFDLSIDQIRANYNKGLRQLDIVLREKGLSRTRKMSA